MGANPNVYELVQPEISGRLTYGRLPSREAPDPGEQLGPELVEDGTFDTGAPWTVPAGWSISGGVATQSAAGALTQELKSAPAAGMYKVSFEIVSRSGIGSMILTMGDTPLSGVALGTHTGYTTLSGADTTISIARGGTATISIDNVSLKKVL